MKDQELREIVWEMFFRLEELERHVYGETNNHGDLKDRIMDLHDRHYIPKRKRT